MLLIAGHTEVLIILRNEALGSNWLLAAMTDEAGLMPTIAPVLHLAGTWHDCLLALQAFGRVLIGVTLSTKEMLIFGSERLVHQRVLALEAVKAALVPVPILVGKILAVTANGFLALLTSVGVQALKALHTVGILFSQDVFLSKQGFIAVVAIKTLGHFDTFVSSN